MQSPPLHAGLGGLQSLGMAGGKKGCSEVEAQGQEEVPDATWNMLKHGFRE